VGGYVLGVDLGTTWTAAAIVRAGGQPEMLSLGGRAAAVPTVVALQPEGWFAVGDAALRRANAEPDRFSREFKRRLGDTTPIILGGSPYSPESLLATVLWWVVSEAAEQEGGQPDAIFVTHPANWGPLRLELLDQAIRLAGITASLVTEPEAAAVHYAAAERVPEGTVIAVYDLGGGTFDATMLRKTATGFERIGRPSGVERLGGLDFDAAVQAHVIEQLGSAYNILDPDDAAVRSAVARLREDCVVAKEALSEDPAAVVPVNLPTINTEVRITRAELEGMIRPSIEQSADVLAYAIRDAGLEPAHVDRILLVGGSSRIPLVSQVLSARFGRPLAIDTHPKHAVALGAARLAGAAAGQTVAPPTPAPTAPPPPTAVPPPPVPVAAGVPATGGSKSKLPLVVGIVVALVAAVALGLSLGGGDDGDGGGVAADGSTSTAPPPTTPTTTAPTAPSTTATTGTASTTPPTGAETLEGTWAFSGLASQCIDTTGVATCPDNIEAIDLNLVFHCDGVQRPHSAGQATASCTVQLLSSDPAGLTGTTADILFHYEGPLSAADGFACDEGVDPTAVDVDVTNVAVGDDGFVTSWEGDVAFRSTTGAPGASCRLERVAYHGDATLVPG
jgi:actin-like ATPase involved in cell morphogenesis